MGQLFIGLLAVVAISNPLLVEDHPPANSWRERFEALKQSQAEAQTRYHEQMEAAKDQEALDSARDGFLAEVRKNTEAGLVLAKEVPDQALAVEILSFVIQTARAGPGDEAERAIEMLLKEHVESEGIGAVGGRIFYLVNFSVAEELLRAILKRNPHREDQGLACHWLAEYLDYQARIARKLAEDSQFEESWRKAYGSGIDRLMQLDPEASEREAEAHFEQAAETFGDVQLERDGSSLAEIAGGRRFEIRHLSIGRPAPEIVGEDVEGQPFQLSDYRGKVVVLTFSGNWCGPCVAMYPHERELVERSDREPLAVLSVNTDEDKETLRAAIEAGEITWRCWWDGGTDGPITTRWGVLGFPTIYVLDPQGVIRYKQVRGEELDKAVDALLAEAKDEGKE